MFQALPFGGSFGGYSRATSPFKRAPNPVTQEREKDTSRLNKSTLMQSGGRVASVKIFRLGNGAVATIIELKTQYAALLTREMLKPVQLVLDQMLATAISLSKGPLTLKRLKNMGHPYGKGKRMGLGRTTRMAGVSNMDVVNKQSGDFSRSWSTSLEIEANGATARLKNDSPPAAFLAFGTSKMKLHGPFKVAVMRHLEALKSAWRGVVKELSKMLNAN